MQLAKREGKYTGGKAKLSAERAAELRKRAKEAGVNKAALAREFGISRAALYVYLNAA
jgi:DNA invertase Pin-like site-specific DNA recombinase